MASGSPLRLVVVTPETTVLDQDVSSLRFALDDGQIGILPGRAPLVGRLGYGELKITGQDGNRSYFVDGGFVQVNGPMVSMMTNQAIPVEEVDVDSAEQQLDKLNGRMTTTEAESEAKSRDLHRIRQMLAVGRRTRG